MSSYIPSSRRLGSTMMKRTSSGVARIRMLVIIALTLTDLPAPVEPAMSRCGIVARSRQERLAVNGLAHRQRQLRGGPLVGVGLEQLAQRDLLAVLIRNLDPDRGLARDAIDDHRLGLHRQAEVVGEAGDLAVLHAGVGLELVGRDDRARDGSARRCLRRRTRGTFPRAAARRPSARARRSSARPWPRRAGRSGGSVNAPFFRSAGALSGSGSSVGSLAATCAGRLIGGGGVGLDEAAFSAAAAALTIAAVFEAFVMRLRRGRRALGDERQILQLPGRSGRSALASLARPVPCRGAS